MLRFVLALAMLSTGSLRAQPPADARATAAIDRALARMGGEGALRAVTSVRMDVMTQWQRISFAVHPYPDQPSYERHQDLRNYTTNAWRNTRNIFPGSLSLLDIVLDTIGSRAFQGSNSAPPPLPLNVAYVDERRELFAFAPERVLLLAKDGGKIRLGADTTIDGVAHTRVSAQIDRFPSTIFLRNTDHLPVMVRTRVNEANDFGLAPFGEMEFETWYSSWAPTQPGLLLPRQRDVRRVGRPYKRMTVLSLTINAPAPPDSFAIAPEIAEKFLETELRPMWKVSLDTVKAIGENFVAFPPQLGTSGAVRVGGDWFMLETGQAVGAAEIANAWIEKQGGKLTGAIVSYGSTSNGGVPWFVTNNRRVWIAPGATRLVRTITGKATQRSLAPVEAARWIPVGTDSLWVEPINIPDAPGVLLVYSPTLKWLYGAPFVGSPLAPGAFRDAIERLRNRGFAVEWTGSARNIRVAIPAP